MKRWLRQFVRKRMNPIPRAYAADMKHKLSATYAFAAYNAFGIMIIMMLYHFYPMTEKEKKQPARYYARLWQGDDVSVYKVVGLRVVDSYEIEGVPDLIPDKSEMQPLVEDTTEVSDKELLTG